MKILNTKNAPTAVGPYVQATCINGFCFLSGQLGLDPKTMKFVSKDVQEQTHQIFKNIINVLKEANLTLNDVCKATVFLSDINDFTAMNEIYAMYFANHKPARSAFEVANLPLGGLVEIEILAVCKNC